MNTKYKVKFHMDDNYKVVELIPNPEYDPEDYFSEEFTENTVHTGRLADCEAWIRLNEGGYM